MQSSQIMVILAWLRNINGEGQQSGARHNESKSIYSEANEWEQSELIATLPCPTISVE